jgi:hypothetical protein
MRRARRRLAVPCPRLIAAIAPLVATFATLILPSVSDARVVAHGTISRAHGGLVRADGAELYVPAGALNEPHAVATISKLRPEKFAFAIRGEWHGKVRVTLPAPPAGWLPVVLHTVHGVNNVESRAAGQMTVWVDHLSTLNSGVPDACLDVLMDGEIGGPEAAAGGFATCLTGYTIAQVTALGVQELIQLAGGSNSSNSGGGPPAADTSIGPGGDLPVSQGAPVTIQGSSPNLQGGPAPGSPPTPSPEPSPTPAPEPSPTPPSPGEASEGFVIEDSIYGGTWARTDPDNGTWYAKDEQPPNGAYWYPNQLGVAVSCAESAASYTAVIHGESQTWTWWAHVTDGKWVPTVVFSSVWSDGLPAGLPEC